MSDIPVWLLDIDGVINAISGKGDPNVWTKDQWHAGEAGNVDGIWPILWSEPVIDFIREVHEAGRAEVRWHTTWQHEAQVVADLIGLPKFTVADAPEFAWYQAGRSPVAEAARLREGRMRPVWWKLPAAERVVREEGRPLIWTDDDITWDLGRYDVDAGLRAYAPALLVSPHKQTGLIPKNLRWVGDFLNIHAPVVTS